MTATATETKGTRKYKHAQFMAALLTAGFAFAVYSKAPADLFTTYAYALCGLSGAFVLGNSAVHFAATKLPPKEPAQ